jgi:2,4-dienoyl-CoA reductase-like NADH-dependent reductase (Old Yellow Enzyme family)
MCTYSADAGHLTDFHLIHLSAFALRGASLTIVEATGVTPQGRITPQCAGLWDDSQIAPLKRIADFVHSQGTKLGIQLAHAGRKAGTVAPWLVEKRGAAILATEDVGGWPKEVIGPSAIPWSHEGYATPKEMSQEDIDDTVRAFGAAAARAIQAGVDVIEIHGAHGYLISSFLSPISNQRRDNYGGSFHNRIRFLIEVIEEVRKNIPDSTPLLLRVSATEYMEHSGQYSWDEAQTIQLAKLLPALGVDLLDVSSGGNNQHQKIDMMHGGYQVGIAGRIRSALKDAGIHDLLIGAVGMITEAEVAKEILQAERGNGGVLSQGDREGRGGDDGIEVTDERNAIAMADVVLIGRQFLREPEWVLRVAQRLGVKVRWPVQYSRAKWRKESVI